MGQLILSAKFAACAGLLGILAACSQSHEDTSGQRKTEPDWVWVKAPDNSFLNTFDFPNGGTSFRRRCWLRNGQYDCLSIFGGGVGGGEASGEVASGEVSYMVFRYQMAKLNRNSSDNPEPPKGGYSCEFQSSLGGIVDEGISGGGGYLDRNQTTLGGHLAGSRVWTAKYVNDFMKDNAPDFKANYFDCVRLASEVLNASLDTFGTTTIKYEEIVG